MQKNTPASIKRSFIVALVVLGALLASFTASASFSLNRFYSPSTTKHYYTTLTIDYPRFGYVLEGSLGQLSSFNVDIYNRPLYALLNRSNRDRILTTSDAEKNYLMSIGFVSDGIMGFTSDYVAGMPNPIAVYRYYSHSKREHFYTNNFNELGLSRYGYTYEGLAFYLPSYAPF